MKSGIQQIADERQKQLDKYTPEHDDKQRRRELANAALAYLELYAARAWVYANEFGVPGVVDGPEVYRDEGMRESWPYDEADWKPESPLKDLVKAAALIAAEIDRLQRAAEKGGAK